MLKSRNDLMLIRVMDWTLKVWILFNPELQLKYTGPEIRYKLKKGLLSEVRGFKFVTTLVIDCMSLSCYVHNLEWIYTLYCLNVMELLAQNSCDIWRLSGSDHIGIQNHLLCKQTRNIKPNWLNDWAVL